MNRPNVRNAVTAGMVIAAISFATNLRYGLAAGLEIGGAAIAGTLFAVFVVAGAYRGPRDR